MDTKIDWDIATYDAGTRTMVGMQLELPDGTICRRAIRIHILREKEIEQAKAALLYWATDKGFIDAYTNT